MARIRFGRRTYVLPANRLVRMAIGAGLVIAGVFGFLPVLGFWMVPLGFVVLSVDLAIVRRWRRAASLALGRAVKRRWPHVWRRLAGN